MFHCSHRLSNIDYAIRGPLLSEAYQMEEAGEEVIKLNIGNPAAFGFKTPAPLVNAVTDALKQDSHSHGYTHSQGLPSARDALLAHYRKTGIDVSYEHIFVGNGVSELISISMLAHLNSGDEILLPSPDYPLWTASVKYSDGKAVFYRCDESSGWLPDLDDLRSKITDRSKGIVIINPNNPTGAVYPPELLEDIYRIAAERKLIIFSDEIYHGIVYDGVPTSSMSRICSDTLCITFSGLSKRYLAAGFRTAWMTMTGRVDLAQEYCDAIGMLMSLRLSSNVPTQYAIIPALEDRSMEELIVPGGRLYEQRECCYRLLNDIPGVQCTKPQGAFYAFPKFDPEELAIQDDEEFCLEFLRKKKTLMVQGSGFHYQGRSHARIVFLADVQTLARAMQNLHEFIVERKTL